MEYGLYIHVPYCKSRCRYCNFYTRAGSRQVPDAYVDGLVRDFERYAPRNGAGRPVRPATVYFGGGTPGLLQPAQVKRLLRVANPAEGAEVTLEVNPECADEARLAGFWRAGVNRLSVGVQTASDESLRGLGRLHTAGQARQALKNARRVGFANISGDVMLALPGYSQGEFDATLDLLQAGGVTHISAYLLKLEAGTAFGKNPPGALPNGDEAADQYLYAVGRLAAAGYSQYEISNFARPGFKGRHNLLYWDGGSWLGLGPAAHSCLLGQRFCFDDDLEAFVGDALPARPQAALTAQDYIMLRLRLSAGLDEAVLAKRYGMALTAGQRGLLDRLCQSGHAVKTAGGWALTPEGMLVQNVILGRLFDG